jgi:hypothetical protein
MAAGIDFRRYRKLRRFVTRVFLQVFWWDVVLNVPGLRRFRRSPLPRYQRLARRYRTLAGEMEGVLIKLGQSCRRASTSCHPRSPASAYSRTLAGAGPDCGIASSFTGKDPRAR